MRDWRKKRLTDQDMYRNKVPMRRVRGQENERWDIRLGKKMFSRHERGGREVFLSCNA